MSEETKTPSSDTDWPLGWRVFLITGQAIADAKRLGFTGDVAATLRAMARFGTPFAHPVWSWRFEGYLFRRVAKYIITGVKRVPPDERCGPIRDWSTCRLGNPMQVPESVRQEEPTSGRLLSLRATARSRIPISDVRGGRGQDAWL